MKKQKNFYDKNLILIIDGFRHGGIQQSYKLLIEKYSEIFEIVTLVVLNATKEDLNVGLKPNFKIINLNSRKFLDLPNLFRLFIIFRKNKPSFIVASIYRSQIWSAIVKNRSSKLIWVEHNTYFDRKKSHWALMALLKNRVHKIVGVSKEVCELTDLKIRVNSICIPNPISPYSSFNKIENRADIFIFVGRLVAQKNPELVLKSFKLYCERYNPDAILNVIGDGPLMTDLISIASELDIKNKCIFHGWLNNEETRSLMNMSRALISTSKYEGMAIVRFEALDSGCCVITTNTGGVVGKLTGKTDLGIFIVEPEAKIISDYMNLSIDPKYWTSENIASRKSLVKEYSIEVIAYKLIE
jgi:glycosyltransferase involved in cell wall biosynthesis